ncbi:MAG: PepSY domain-containing protein [Gammaproteobacteria bacterium]
MKKLLLTITLIATGFSAGSASADDDSREVRRLVQEGKVISLDALLDMHRDRLQGRILDLEMEEEHGRVIYEIKTLDAEGVVREVEVDAQTGEWLREKVKSRRKDDGSKQ